MKIEILKENLKNGIGIVERIVGRNVSLPILDNVFMSTEDSFLNIVSTDLETVIRLWILAKVVKKGSAVVPAKFLSSFISSLPNEKITIEEKSQNLYIECENVKTQVRGYNPEEFPIIPEFKDIEFLEVEAKQFYQGLSQVIDIPMASQSRPEISGIYFTFSKNTLKMVATDSFRLAEKNITLATPVTKEYSFILPQKPAKEIANILNNKEGLLKMYFSNNQVMVELPMKETNHPQVQIISRLIEGEYPNYQEIIPQKFKTHAVVKREELLHQIKTASLFSGRVNEVKISLGGDKQGIEVSAKNPDIGEHNSVVPAKVEGDEISISFNYKFLLDGLAYIKSSEIVFDVSKEEGPCILRPVGDSSYIYVVMPIKSI